MTPTAAQQMAQAIVDAGFAAHRPVFDSFVAAARHSGVCAVVLDVLVDEASPPVTRLRALGRAVAAYAASDSDPHRPAPRPPVHPTPRPPLVGVGRAAA